METAGGKPVAAVSAQLFREPWRFEFFQAVRLLEWIAWGALPREPRARARRP